MRKNKTGGDDRGSATTGRGGRRSPEQALRESEQRYRHLVEDINEIVFAVDATGRLTYISPAVTSLGGYTPSEMVGRPFTDFVHPDDVPSAMERFRGSLSGDPEPIELRFVSKSGEVHWVRSFARPILDGDRVVGLRGVQSNVTERKQAEHALRDSEERYRTVFELAFEGIVIHEDGVILDANPAFERMYRYKLSELVGMSMLRLTAQESRDLVLQKFRSASEETYEAVALRKDGTTFLAEVLAKRRTYKGRRVRVVAVRDITERKRAEQALRDSEERFRQVAATANEWISEVDAEGRFTYSSPAVKDILGYEPQEIIGKHFFDFYTPEDRKHLLAEAREIGAAKKTYLGAIARNVHKDGHTVIVESSGLPILDPEGNVAGYRNVARDVTERRRVEEALRESEEQWRSLVENIPDIVMTVDRDGTILFINRTLPGFTAEATMGAIVYDYVPPEHHDTLRRSLEGVFETGDGHDYEIAAPGPFGRTSWYFNRIGPVVRDGRVVAAAVIATDITERKRMEEALRQSEERYRLLVEDINEAIYQLDATGRITYISPVVEEVGGYSPSEVVGRPFADFLHPDDLSGAVENFQRAVSGHPRPNEYRLLSKSGEVLWARSFGRLIREGDRVVGVRGVLTDITERKRMEEALRESEERYRDLAENLNDAIFEFDTSGRMTYISSGMQEVSGYSPSEMIGRPFTQFVYPEDLPAVTERIQERPFGNRQPSEYRLLRKSGEVRWVQSLGRPVFAGDRVVAFRGVLTDITERKQAEDALRQSEGRYRTLVEAAPDVIYSLSRDGIITSLNSAFESISGWSRDEWLGKHFAAIIHPDDLPAAAEDFRLTLRGEVPPVGEYRMLAKSGQYLSVETVPRPLIVDGKVVATFGIARDISERKRMEEALQSTREELESAVERQMQLGNPYGLTFRELTVLHLVADGRSDREIAAILGISNQTAHKHVASILSKMGVGSRTEASVRAVREGVLD
jgi:PAS domain S-box-containing protein